MSNPALQAEVQRLQCLQALGITVYHPRYRLPGAKPSVQGPWPEVDVVAERDIGAGVETLRAAAAVEMPQRNDSTRAERPREIEAPTQRANVRAAFDEPVAPAPAQVAPPVAQARKPEGAAVAVQNFQLLFLQVDADLVVVNQIPALARPKLHDKPLALLANLLRWLGKSVPAQSPRVFRWPLPGLENMAATMNPETSLLHFLEQACTERSFRYVLHLGPQAVAAPSSAWQSFATHSLDEMLALPALKREAWQALLPLHALLHANA